MTLGAKKQKYLQFGQKRSIYKVLDNEGMVTKEISAIKKESGG
jgi:hypothetical protein